MARLSNDELEQIKHNISLLRLVGSQGYEIKKQGKDYVTCCPFHEDNTPSLVITPDKNLFHCFGCDAAGSVIDWVMKTQGVSFKHAVELLRKDISLVADDIVKKYNTVPKLAQPLADDADKQTALQQVIAFYHKSLRDSVEAQSYLKQRGLDDVELINHFKLGYANRTLGLHLPQRNRQSGAKLRGLLQAIGIYRDSGHEHFNGSLIIPIINDQKVKEVYGRKLLGSKLRKGTPQHLYLPGPHQGIFNREGLANTKEVILCESLIDALTFWRWGFKHVTTSYGVNGFTDELLQCFIDQGIQRVLIAYDRDPAGDKAAIALVKRLNKNNIDAYRIQFPKNMDANEYACTMTPAQKSLALVIRKAEPLGTVIHQINQLLVAASAEQALDNQATPAPTIQKPTIPMEIKENAIYLTLGDRVYRIKGFDAKTQSDQLKINLMISKLVPCGNTGGEAIHLDKLDLYSSKQRQVFINQASVECSIEPDVIKADLGKVLLQLEQLQHTQAEDTQEEIKPLSTAERDAALSLLKDKDLLTRILTDFMAAGIVGEQTNTLVGYLACVSRKLDRPLAIIIQSTSAAGKSSLMDAILNLMPEDERVQYSAMTGQSLFYMGETNLKHKILAISEEEGASNASYALKLLQSEGEVTIASTGKDDDSGDLVTKEYRVEGPVMLFMTTTAIDIDEELMNRCLVLTVNESREQTQAIHAAQRQRRTLQGLQNKLKTEQLTQLHRNAQQLLKPLAVINPYADQLTFIDDKTRTRRDHEKYLTLIDSIALLHQYQREVKTIEHDVQGSTSAAGTGSPGAASRKVIEYIEVTLDDIETANQLANEVLGKTLDELPPQTRKLLKAIQTMVQRHCAKQDIKQNHYYFSRKDIRAFTQWSDGQLKIHCKRLEEMEYLLVRQGRRGQIIHYELLYSGDTQTNTSQLMGLLDTDALHYDGNKSGQKAEKTGPSQGQVRAKSDPAKPLNGASTLTYSESSQASTDYAHPAI